MTISVLIVLTLCIGANSAIFSVVESVLLRPIPWKDPEGIVTIWGYNNSLGIDKTIVSPASFLFWKENSQTLEKIAGWRFLYFNISGKDEPERVQGLTVTADYFSLLGVSAEIGRTFIENDEKPGNEKVVILSNPLWRRRFNANPDIVGQKVIVEGEPHVVIGVLPSKFWIFPVLNRPLDMYVPMVINRNRLNPNDLSMFAYARIKQNYSIDQVSAELDSLSKSFLKLYPEIDQNWSARAISLSEGFIGQSRSMLLIVLVAVGLVLLIACANIANLFLARSIARQREIAVRLALGAGRLRLIRQLLTESTMLSIIGGISGLLFAYAIIDLLNHFIPFTALVRVEVFYLDLNVVIFTFILSLITGILFGLAPALHLTGMNLNEIIKMENLTSSSHRGNRLRSILIVSELALTVMLLIGAGLLIQSMLHLMKMDRGIDTNNVLTMQIWLPRAKYSEAEQISQFFNQALQQIDAIPGVEASSVINFSPLSVQYTTSPFSTQNDSVDKVDKLPTTRYSVVSSSYFKTMRIPLLSGRNFTEQDNDELHGTVIVSQAMAEKYFSGKALGRQIKLHISQTKNFWVPQSKNLPLTIIGVVGDVQQEGLAQSELPQVYLPYYQNPSSIMNLMVRTKTEPLSIAQIVRERIISIDKDQPVFDIKTMEKQMEETFSRSIIMSTVLAIFAILALLLSVTGVYSIISYSVSQRTKEIGIRMSLGAQPSDILRMIIGQVLKLAFMGISIGLVGSLILNSILNGLLFGLSPTDPITFFSIALLLVFISLLAGFIPAYRAMKIDPAMALRQN
ncbi:MAG: ABC transporter permease [Acidobacteriota bacterium]